MPMIDVTYVHGSLDDQALRRLTDELVTALLRAERAPDTAFLRENTLATSTRWRLKRSRSAALARVSLDSASR